MPLTRNKKRWLLGVLILLALLLPGYLYFRSWLQFKRAHDELKLLAGPEGQVLPPEEQNKKLINLRTQMNRLTFRRQTELLDELMEERREHIRRFFTLSPEEQQAQLDEEIEALEELKDFVKKMQRAQQEASAEAGEGSQGKNGRGGSSGRGGVGPDSERPGLGAGAGGDPGEGMDAAGHGNGPVGPSGQGGPGDEGIGDPSSDFGGPGSMLGPGHAKQRPFETPEDRLEKLKQFLDASHPKDRAHLALYTQMMLQRKAQTKPGSSVPSAR